MNNFNPTNEIRQLLAICIEKIKQDPMMVDLVHELENLMPKLENVEVKKVSEYVISEPLTVKNENGKIMICLGKEQAADYQKHLLVELMAAVMKGDSIALKKGLSSIIINNTIGSEDLALRDEEICTNLLAETYGFDIIFDSAVKGDVQLNPEDIIGFKNVTALMNHNYEYRKKTQKSHLASIQKLIISNFVGKDDLNEAKVNNFEMNLYSGPNKEEKSNNLETHSFYREKEEKYDYPGIEEVNPYFQQLKKNMNFDEIIKVK